MNILKSIVGLTLKLDFLFAIFALYIFLFFYGMEFDTWVLSLLGLTVGWLIYGALVKSMAGFYLVGTFSKSHEREVVVQDLCARLPGIITDLQEIGVSEMTVFTNRHLTAWSLKKPPFATKNYPYKVTLDIDDEDPMAVTNKAISILEYKAP